jgi:hypothetical protein
MAVVALVLGIGTPLLAPPDADGAVLICKRKKKIVLRETCKANETAVAPSELGSTGPAGPAGPAGATGAQGPAGPGARWALVDQDGTILAQSGGITFVAGFAPGETYLNFGVSLTGKVIVATKACTDADCGFSGTVEAALCGGTFVNCIVTGTNNDQHVFVGTSAAGDSGAEAHAYWVAVF